MTIDATNFKPYDAIIIAASVPEGQPTYTVAIINTLDTMPPVPGLIPVGRVSRQTDVKALPVGTLCRLFCKPNLPCELYVYGEEVPSDPCVQP